MDEVQDFLEHVGVKGMKWGVRRQARQARLGRVARGQGSVGDNLRVALTDVSTLSVLRRGGIQGAAVSRLSQVERHRQTIESGTAQVHDLIGIYGSRLIITGRN